MCGNTRYPCQYNCHKHLKALMPGSHSWGCGIGGTFWMNVIRRWWKHSGSILRAAKIILVTNYYVFASGRVYIILKLFPKFQYAHNPLSIYTVVFAYNSQFFVHIMVHSLYFINTSKNWIEFGVQFNILFPHICVLSILITPIGI